MTETNLVKDFIDDILERISNLLERIIPKDKRYAPALQFADNVVINAAGFGALSLKGPTMGRFWYVRKIRVSGVTPTTTAAGRADVFICAKDIRDSASLAQCPITAWRDQAQTLPLVASYGHGELRVGPQEQVWIAFSNATAGQTYVASLEAFEYPDVDENVEWII